MIPSDIRYDANATPPHWTDNQDQVIEKGTNVRIKIKGVRSEVDRQFAIGTMKEVSLRKSTGPERSAACGSFTLQYNWGRLCVSSVDGFG
jgi:DNA-directed RNA polymerase subunit E'/Rpb7